MTATPAAVVKAVADELINCAQPIGLYARSALLNPPRFHEQRSLSERLYRDQGIDTQTLLGHKSRSMTDKDNDDRGKEWKVMAV